MKFGVVIFPGSNCDQDVIHTLGSVMGQEVVALWHKETDLGGLSGGDCIILPGGFSYGDYLRSGAIARFSPVMKEVIRFAGAGGMVFGICNGFQILCESGLLPGALLRNEHQKFICRDVHIRVQSLKTAATAHLTEGQVLGIPVAHAEGRFYADATTLQALRTNEQVLFTYCDREGNTGAAFNPNGSADHIAGICNREGNVFGLMPHPERASESAIGGEDGRLLFESIVSTALQNDAGRRPSRPRNKPLSPAVPASKRA